MQLSKVKVLLNAGLGVAKSDTPYVAGRLKQWGVLGLGERVFLNTGGTWNIDQDQTSDYIICTPHGTTHDLKAYILEHVEPEWPVLWLLGMDTKIKVGNYILTINLDGTTTSAPDVIAEAQTWIKSYDGYVQLNVESITSEDTTTTASLRSYLSRYLSLELPAMTSIANKWHLAIRIYKDYVELVVEDLITRTQSVITLDIE